MVFTLLLAGCSLDGVWEGDCGGEDVRTELEATPVALFERPAWSGTLQLWGDDFTAFGGRSQSERSVVLAPVPIIDGVWVNQVLVLRGDFSIDGYQGECDLVPFTHQGVPTLGEALICLFSLFLACDSRSETDEEAARRMIEDADDLDLGAGFGMLRP